MPATPTQPTQPAPEPTTEDQKEEEKAKREEKAKFEKPEEPEKPSPNRQKDEAAPSAENIQTHLSVVLEQIQKLGAVLAQLEKLEEPEKPSAENIQTHLSPVLEQLKYAAELFEQANNRKANQKPSAVEKPEEPERSSPQSIQTQLDVIRAATDDIQVAIDAIFNAEGAPDLDDIAAVVAVNKNIQLLIDVINPPHSPRVEHKYAAELFDEATKRKGQQKPAPV
jgi:hypothetical protein